MKPSGQLQQRVARLRAELHEELGLVLPDEALEELAFTRYSAPHEGKRSAYGAVVGPFDQEQGRPSHPPLPSLAGFLDSGRPIEVLRLYADGRTSFVMRRPGGEPTLGIDPAWRGDEATLAAYANRTQTVVLQRLASGRIRIFDGVRVCSEEGGSWLSRPTAASYFEQLAPHLSPDAHPVARTILDLCVHTLSPAGHGATVVWFPDGQEPSGPFLDDSVAATPPALSAAQPDHAAAIGHALGQLDRAVLLDAAGRLVRANITLSSRPEDANLGFTGGTRHNSAGRYSAADERGVVFVVSADGPVTVLRAGQILAAPATGG